MTPLNAKELKAAQKALRYYQAIDAALSEAGLAPHAAALQKPWVALILAVTTTLQHNPALGSTLLPMQAATDKKDAKPEEWTHETPEEQSWRHFNTD